MAHSVEILLVYRDRRQRKKEFGHGNAEVGKQRAEDREKNSEVGKKKL
jgi:hypothetical protein